MTLIDLCLAYGTDRYLRRSTTLHYARVITLFIRDTAISLATEVTRDVVLLWRKECLDHRCLSTASWNNYVRHMKALFNYAISQNLLQLPANPFNRCSVSQQSRKKKLVHPEDWKKIITLLRLSKEAAELDQRRDVFGGASWFWLILLQTSDRTGMRLRQLVSLKWKDVDLRRQIINLRVEGSKTLREWEIPMHADACHDLRFLLVRTVALLGPRIEDCQVFNVNLFSPRHRQEIMQDYQILNFCKRVLKLTHVRVSPHMLRHTLATDLMRSPDRNIKMVKDLLGHTSIKTTLEYVQTDIEEVRGLLNSVRTCHGVI